MIAYHVTPSENLDSILREGLCPKIGPRSSEGEEPIPAVYLFASAEDCEQGLMGWLGEVLDDEAEISILKVDLSGLEIDSPLGWELRVETIISAERILATLSEDQFQQSLNDTSGLRYQP